MEYFALRMYSTFPASVRATRLTSDTPLCFDCNDKYQYMMIIIKNRCYRNKISNFLYLFYFSYIFFNNFLLFWNVVSWFDCNVRSKVLAVPLRADSRAKTGSRLPVMSRTVSLSTAISVILQREIKEWVIEYTNEKMNNEARKRRILRKMNSKVYENKHTEIQFKQI